VGLAAAVGAPDDGGAFGVLPAQLLAYVLYQGAKWDGGVGNPQDEIPVSFFGSWVVDGPVNENRDEQLAGFDLFGELANFGYGHLAASASWQFLPSPTKLQKSFVLSPIAYFLMQNESALK